MLKGKIQKIYALNSNTKTDLKGLALCFTTCTLCSPQKRVHSAIAKYFAGDLKSALKDYDKVFELEPNLPNIDQIHFNRGLCRYDLGDKAGADEDYKTARKLNPKRKYIYYDKRG